MKPLFRAAIAGVLAFMPLMASAADMAARRWMATAISLMAVRTFCNLT